MKKIIATSVSILLLATTVMAKGTSKSEDPISLSLDSVSVLINQKNYAMASYILKGVLLRDQKNGRAYTYLSKIGWAAGLYADVIQSSSLAISYLPKKEVDLISSNYSMQGRAALALGDTVQAEKYYKKAIDVKPSGMTLAYAYASRGDVYSQQKKWELAKKEYQSSNAYSDGLPLGNEGLARIAMVEKKYEEAKNYLSKVLEYGNFSYDNYLRAICNLELKNESEAIHDIGVFYSDTQNQQTLSNLLGKYYSPELYKQWVSYGKLMCIKYPDSPEWLRFLAMAYFANEEVSLAAETYLKVGEIVRYLTPEDAKKLAFCFQNMGDNELAMSYIQYAVSRDSTMRKFEARILADENKIDEALAICEELNAAGDDDALHLMTVNHWYKRDYVKAEECAKKVVERVPSYAYGYYELATIQYLLGKTEEAKENCRKAFEKSDSKSELVVAYYYLGEPEKAVSEFQAQLSQDIANGARLFTVYYRGACLYSLLGETDQALDYLSKALDQKMYQFTHLGYDSDLDNIRKDKRYIALVDKYKKKQQVELKNNAAMREHARAFLAQMVAEDIYMKVDKKASFPGGSTEMMVYLNKSLVYPQECVQGGIQGRVYLSFIVEKDGTLSDIQVQRSVHPLLDAEAIRVVKGMPTWIPAEVKGKPCRTRYTLPVLFRIK